MSHALNLRLRNSSGLAITVAVHIAMGAALLIGFDIVSLKAPPRPPLMTKPIPEPIKRVQTVEPITTEQTVTIDVPEPLVGPVVSDPLWTHPVTAEPLVDPKGGPEAVRPLIIDPPLPAGPSTGAKLDPRYAAGFQPPYPSASQRLGEAGTVVLHVAIDASGRVTAATVARSSGFARLDAAAVAHALAKWRFVAALANGVAVVAERDISVVFRIENAR